VCEREREREREDVNAKRNAKDYKIERAGSKAVKLKA
jgi:hypothetical protein